MSFFDPKLWNTGRRTLSSRTAHVYGPVIGQDLLAAPQVLSEDSLIEDDKKDECKPVHSQETVGGDSQMTASQDSGCDPDGDSDGEDLTSSEDEVSCDTATDCESSDEEPRWSSGQEVRRTPCYRGGAQGKP